MDMISESDLFEIDGWLSTAEQRDGEQCSYTAQRKLLSLLIKGKSPRSIIKEIIDREILWEDLP